MDTIFAQATAPGRAGVAIVRISGADAFGVAGQLMSPVPEDRGLRILRWQGDVLDQALVLTFQDRASFTGEPVVELHLHGSQAVVAAVLSALGQTNARPAEPGEFTRRALDNGRLDLAQVEGLADLIDAETEGQRRQAMNVFSGALGDLAATWRQDLIRAAALIEATIDFADEEVPVDVTPEVNTLLSRVRDGMAGQIAGVAAAERVRAGFEVAIVGEPNIGKSTLLNRLAGRDAAITSEVAGTTRDVIEVRMDLGGLAVTLLDTAGIRQTTDIVEEIGVKRALERANAADLRVFLVAPDENPPMPEQPGDIVVIGKGDLLSDRTNTISGTTGLGVDRLIDKITETLSDRAAGAGVAIRERHRIAMRQAVEQIDDVQQMLTDHAPSDLIAEDIRAALRSVDSIVGHVDVEDLLGEIFASFCIGK